MMHTTIFEQAGGEEPFRRMVELFYTQVEQDLLLRPLYPADLEPGKRHLLLFIMQYFVGPAQYSAERGHPRLRMRHMPFSIGQPERDAWLMHMLSAMEQAGFPEMVKPALHEYFVQAANFLINTPPSTIDVLG